MNESHDYADLCELINNRILEFDDCDYRDGGEALLAALEDLEGAPEEFERVVELFALALDMKKSTANDPLLRTTQRVAGKVFSYRVLLNLLDATVAGLVKVHPGTMIVLSPDLVAFMAELIIPFGERLNCEGAECEGDGEEGDDR
ncbi:MAG: hypothetical protein IJM54_10275 [Thermoguttaceae bacterium]|nr:hypothetical protein [Thermoguttaceae bacterium]